MLTSATSRCCRPPSRLSRAHKTLEFSSIASWHYQHTSQHSVGLGTTSSDTFAGSSSRQWKLQELQLRRLFPASWIIAVCCSAVCRTLYCASCSLCRMPLHDWSLARDAVIISPVLCELRLATHLRARQLRSGMSALPVAVRAGASLQQLPSRVQQCSLRSAGSSTDLRGAANTQQLWRQNIYGHGTSPVELSSTPAA